MVSCRIMTSCMFVLKSNIIIQLILRYSIVSGYNIITNSSKKQSQYFFGIADLKVDLSLWYLQLEISIYKYFFPLNMHDLFSVYVPFK